MTSENYRNERSYQKYFMEGMYNISGWQPFLHHLKGYYASHDKFRTIVDDGYEHQLSMKNYYVNLVLVTEERHTGVVKHLRTEENSREREERYQAMLLSGQTLSVDELYRNLNRTEEAGWISITGRAGTGKTTLLQYISHCWGAERKGSWHNRFDFVFRVQLNLLKAYIDRKDLTMLEMLRQIIYESFEKTDGYDEVLSRDNIDNCLEEKSFRNRTLLLLDGFDEIQGLYNEGHKHIKDFIDDVMRQFPNGMMATRPDVLPKTLLAKFKHQYENVGFSVDNVYQYVDKYFQEGELAHKESLLAALHANPEMASLAQVPIHAHILCLIWKDSAGKLSNSHLTMTQLYHELMLWLMKRYCYKFKSLTERSPKQLFSICDKEITTLCEIAYNAFTNNNVQFIRGDFVQNYVKSSSFMDVLSREFGVLRTFNEKELGYADYFFIHLTCQEFFVALYIAKYLRKEPSPYRQQEIERRQKILSLAQHIANNRDARSYQVIWIFLAGLVSMPEYAIGADYFWDAIIDFPEEKNIKVFTFHPHIKLLLAQQRIYKEAFLNLLCHPHLEVPKRLSNTRTHLKHIYLWQGVQKTKKLMQTWDDSEKRYSFAARAYYHAEQQYQSDAMIWGSETKTTFSLDTFLLTIPLYQQYVNDLLIYCTSHGRDWERTMYGKVVFEAISPANIRVLLNALKNPDEHVRFHASLSLRTLKIKDPTVIQDLLLSLEDPYNLVRSVIAWLLGNLGVKEPAVIQGLQNLLKDSDEEIHTAAACSLVKLRVIDITVIQVLQDLLKSPNNFWRANTALKVGELKINDSAIIQNLQNLLKDPNEDARESAALSLFKLGVRNAAILRLLSDKLEGERKRPLSYFSKTEVCLINELGPDEPIVREVVRNSSSYVRFRIAGESNAIHVLQDLLKDPRQYIRNRAARTLASLGKTDSIIISSVQDQLKDPYEREDAAIALGKSGVKSTLIIQDLQKALQDSKQFINQDIDQELRFNIAHALVRLGARDPLVIQCLQDTLNHPSEHRRLDAIIALRNSGIRDITVIQNLQKILQGSKHSDICYVAAIKALTYLGAIPVEVLVELLQNMTISPQKEIYHKITLAQVYTTLVRMRPEDYIPYLANSSYPDMFYLFIATSYFQGGILLQKEDELFLNGILLGSDPKMIQDLYAAKIRFIDGMSDYSESLDSMHLAVNIPKISDVFSENFLTNDLPVESFEPEQRLNKVEKAINLLLCYTKELRQDIEQIKEELGRIKNQMESDWERAQIVLSDDDVAYIKIFKRNLVQMYIIATVAASDEVQITLTGTTSSVVTVLDTISGLVPWGGGAVQLLSSMIQSLDNTLKQKRMQCVTHLGDTPEEVARLATMLGKRLLHCLEIEHHVQDGRIARLFNTLSVLSQRYQDGFYNTLFSVLTGNKTETPLTPSDMETRAANDAQLLLSAIMEKGVPLTQENQVDIDRLFLYSAPLLTVIDQVFDRIKTLYCSIHRYKPADIEIKRKIEFCAAIANQCQEQASDTANYIEDQGKREIFIESLATAFNQHRNLLYKSKAFTTWSVFGKTTTLSINRDILEPEVIRATYTGALRK